MIDAIREDTGDTAILKVRGEITVENVGSLKTALVESMEGKDAVLLDLAEVDVVDVAGLQLLCSAHRTGCSLNKRVAIGENTSPGFREAVRDSGYVRTEACAQGSPHCLWIGGNTDG